MLHPVAVSPLPNYRLRLHYADGVQGDVDLSHLVGKGVFCVWSDAREFAKVVIGSDGAVRWSDEIELCADALYLQITSKAPEEVFPNLLKA